MPMEISTKMVCVFLLISLIGCARTQTVLGTSYEPQETHIRTNDYQINVRSIRDIREDKLSLGALGNTDVSSEGFIEWLKNALKHRGYEFDIDVDSEQLECEVDVSLKLAYIRSSSTSKATNIVLAINSNDTDELTYYRGTHAGMNWSSSKSEISTSFAKALEVALDSMEADLLKSCLGPISAESH